MSYINIYMSIIAFLGSLVYYIQSYKVFKKKSASDLSLLSYIISCFTSLNWLIYGLATDDLPLIASGFISIIGSILVVLCIIIYKKSNN